MSRRQPCTCNAVFCGPGSGHEDYCGLVECGWCGEFETHTTESCPHQPDYRHRGEVA